MKTSAEFFWMRQDFHCNYAKIRDSIPAQSLVRTEVKLKGYSACVLQPFFYFWIIPHFLHSLLPSFSCWRERNHTVVSENTTYSFQCFRHLTSDDGSCFQSCAKKSRPFPLAVVFFIFSKILAWILKKCEECWFSEGPNREKAGSAVKNSRFQCILKANKNKPDCWCKIASMPPH